MSTNPQPTTTTQDPGVEDLQVLVSTALSDLQSRYRMVRHLIDTRQRGLGFATVEAKQQMDKLARAERTDRRQAEIEGQPTGTGETMAPGNLTVWAYLAHAHDVLTDLIQASVAEFMAGGVCTLHQAPAEPSFTDLVNHIRVLSWDVTSPRLLQLMHTQIEHLTSEARRLVDGNDRTRLDAPCPHCARKTLVVYFDTGVIRCDRDPFTGRLEDCTCPDPMCGCKTNPLGHRHEWHRSRGTGPGGWRHLADRLNLTRNT